MVNRGQSWSIMVKTWSKIESNVDDAWWLAKPRGRELIQHLQHGHGTRAAWLGFIHHL
jgi:hypothetical protein